MNDCPSLEQIEGALERPHDFSDVSAHIRDCPACGAQVTRVRENNAMLEAFRDCEPEALAAAFHDTDPQRGGDTPEGYEIVSELHRGGQGIVFVAIQQATKRQVALKMLLPGVFATRRQQARFEREIELAAGLRHPSIVTVYDSGRTAGGRHFLAMELIDGVSLADYVRGVREREPTGAAFERLLELFTQICGAIEYAHRRGVIHRDLKPGNILVDAEGRPSILDFGVAKPIADDLAGDQTAPTRDGEFLGTLAYAAPEQLCGDPDRIDTRTDVYALGIILYDLLTDRPPYPIGGALRDALRHITETLPAPPSSHDRRIGQELDAIVLKALAKEPERRYPSAAALADDLRRFLAGEPIEARRSSGWYVLSKTVRRHRMAAITIATFLVLLLGFGVTMSVLYERTVRAERVARESAASLAATLSLSNIERGRLAVSTPAAERLIWREHLATDASGRPAADGRPPGRSKSYWALWELYNRQPCFATVFDHEARILCVEHSSDSRRVITAGRDGLVRSRDAHSALPIEEFRIDGLATESSEARFSRGAQFLVWTDTARVELWDLEAQQRIVQIDLGDRVASAVAIDPAVEQIAVGCDDGTIDLYEATSGDLRQTLSGHAHGVTAVEFAPAGRHLASSAKVGNLRLWDLESGESLAREPTEGKIWNSRSICFTPDGALLAAGNGRTVMLMRMPDLEPVAALHGHMSFVQSLDFSRDGRTLASGSFNDKTVRLWDVERASLIATRVGHEDAVYVVSISDDGERIASGSHLGVLKLWEARSNAAMQRVELPGSALHDVCFSPDGRWLVAAGGSANDEREVGLIEWRTRDDALETARRMRFERFVQDVEFSPDSQRLVAGGQDAVVRIISVESGEVIFALEGHEGSVGGVAFSPDGTAVASVGSDRTVRIWDAVEGVAMATLRGHEELTTAVAFSPDGRMLASSGHDARIIVWNLPENSRRFEFRARANAVRALHFSPDGRMLATGGDDWTVRIWDVEQGVRLRTLEGHRQDLFALVFSPDGRLLASGDRGAAVLLWDVATGENLARLDGHASRIMGLSFSPTGYVLASAGGKGRVGLWNLAYYDWHIAGNLAFQVQRLEGLDAASEYLRRLGEWAAQVQAR